MEIRISLGWLERISTIPYERFPKDKRFGWNARCNLSDSLVEDYKHYFQFMQETKQNHIILYGLFGENWPRDIKKGIQQSRKEKIRKIIKYAHEKKIKLLLGFGINSYGLKEIVQDNTELSAINENGKKIMNVLCSSNTESLEWMKSILRYVISNYDIDGVELQSADQGRCMCKKCREKSNR